jgi:HEAT repeat protein
MALSVLLAQCTEAGNVNEQSLQSHIRNLESPVRYERQQATTALQQADTIAILHLFKETFPMLRHEGRFAFQTGVLPHLLTKDVDAFLLKEFRAGFPTQQKVKELERRAEEEGESCELEAIYQQLSNDYEWWHWVVRAIQDLSYVPTYEELYAMLLKLNERGFPSSTFAKALHQRDPKRAEADFQKLLSDPDGQMKLRGIWALEAARVVPPTHVTLEFFEGTDVALLDQADQFVHKLRREHLDLLLSLVASPSKRVRAMAEYRLRRIGHTTSSEAARLVANTAKPEERAEAWRLWWAKHRDDSDEALRQHCATVLASEANSKLTQRTLLELAQYGDHAEVYPIFFEAISSADLNLRRTAIMQLGNMARRHDAAADMLIKHCRELGPEDFGEFAGCLAPIKDKRIESLFVKVLEAQPGKDTLWKRRVARTIGQAGHKWALQPLVRLIIEEGCSNAAGVLTHVEGAEHVAPQLLEAMVKETDRHKRHAIRSAIEGVGAERLAQKLTKILPQAAERPVFKGGPRYDVLRLMELFPDPNSKPLLLELLNSENPWVRLGAARVLGKLGDYSGMDCLVQNLQPTRNISASYLNSYVGKALRMIGSPDTKNRLQSIFAKGDLEVKKIALHIMAQQGDPAYLSIFEKQLEASEPDVAAAARHEIAYLISLCNKDKPERLDILDEDDLPPLRAMFLWAFFDDKLIEPDPSYPDYQSLKKLKGAVVRVNTYQHIEFTTADKNLQLLSHKSNKRLTASDGTKPGRQQPYAEGQIERSVLGYYMTISLRLNYGGASYLFKHVDDNWQPLSYLGGVVE